MRKTGYLIVVLFAVATWSCQTEPDSEMLIDQMVVSTNFDPEADFSSYTTFAIPSDTIGFQSNSSSDTIITASNSDFPRPVLSAIRNNIEQLGYTRVGRNEDPDIGVNVMVVNDYNVFQDIVYPNYYGYPGSYYYPGYYGYGSYYSYPYVNTYAYNTGVLIVEMVDLRNRTPDNKVKVVWDAYMGDVYSTIDRIRQSTEAIDQAFLQSPYLGK